MKVAAVKVPAERWTRDTLCIVSDLSSMVGNKYCCRQSRKACMNHTGTELIESA